MVSVVT